MIKRLALWLCRVAGVQPTIEAARLMNGKDAVERGARWESFWREQGGLADMLEALRFEAFEAAQEAKANDDQTRLAWMLQDRAYRQLKNRIEAVIINGTTAAARIKETERLNAARVFREY